MIFDRIELKSGDDVVKKSSNKIRKIKFKSISFKSISNLWKKFRISQLEKRLEKSKDKLVSMEFDNQDFNTRTLNGSLSVAENKIIKKTMAISRLESKINFLKTGNKTSEEFISSRAIKLKDNMLKNLVYNMKSAYSLPADKVDEVFATKAKEKAKKIEEKKAEQPTATDEVMTDAQRKVAENVQRIMAEKKVVTPEPVKEQVTEAPVVTVTAPSREEIRRTVNEMFAAQEAELAENKAVSPVVTEQELKEIIDLKVEPKEEPTIGMGEVGESIEDVLAKIDARPPVSEEVVEETVNEELDTIRVSQNESSAAKVDKYINDDGTYRMTRENIDDDFRITRFTRNPDEAPTMVGLLRENILNAQLKAIDEKYSQKPKETSSAPVQNPQAQEEVARELPIVVPERRESVKETVKELSAAVDEVKTMDDIKQIMASVAELRKLQEQTNFKAQAVAEDSAELRAEKSQAVQELLEYQASLQEDYDASRRQVEEQQAANEALVKEIQSIRDVIGGGRRK